MKGCRRVLTWIAYGLGGLVGLVIILVILAVIIAPEESITDQRVRTLVASPAEQQMLITATETTSPKPTQEIGGLIKEGTYLVGRDDGLESCDWSRLNNVSGEDDILANDDATGQYFVEVLATDFALLVGCEIEKID